MKNRKPYNKDTEEIVKMLRDEPSNNARLIRNVVRTELDIITANTLGRFGCSRENIWSIKEAMEAKMQELARLHHNMHDSPFFSE